MSNLLFKRWNDFGGWLVFLIAAFVYGMTIEPTASFWDCPEFISCAEKLQVGHPPGAPFYMLVGNLFTQLASDASQVSGMVNFLNALLSAGCILFLFWSITRLVRALLVGDERKLSVMDVIIILGAGFVGALAYTFSDTFWFSAVEGEVYAFSSFLTALVFWMILCWQDEADSVSGDRWIILIAYIIGLSIGVHLLNLLCIPAIVLVFYYQKYQTLSLKGVIGAIALSGILIVLILFVYIPGMADVGGWFELFFVNVMGLPFQSGLIVFLGLVLFLLIGAIYRFRKRIVNTGLWCLLMLTIGYTTYAVILIRANANTPLNENAPDTIFTLKSYLNREQYESAPLLYGRTYASEPEYVPEGDYYKVKTEKGSAIYRPDKKEGKYKIIRYKEDVCYTQNMLFPRMWNDRSAASYKGWSGGGANEAPTQKENLTYFITYQLNYMYWRYFLWNFVGRQNDIQGSGEPEHGNWITGISWLDNLRLGDQKLLPESLRENKGHNVFYGLPLLLGLLGIYWQWTRGKKGKQQFSVLFFLFFMTGLAIVLYLNQTPGQPRERDYAYAGSFYAFAIWIGMGAAGCCDMLRRKQAKILPVGLLMTQHCTACQLCVSVCPNQVLRPSDNLLTLMQPEMSYERGYCRPECTKCSEVCPAGAIHLTSLAEKSAIQIGHAVWIKENCVPLTDGMECGNCARHCPTGAIQMVASDPEKTDSPKIPVVNVEKCIGCGACENLCPSRPFSAIYVTGHQMHRII